MPVRKVTVTPILPRPPRPDIFAVTQYLVDLVKSLYRVMGDYATAFNEFATLYNANELANPVYDDFTTSGVAIGTGANAPDSVIVGGWMALLGFDGAGSTEEQGFFTVHLLHGLAAGSDMTFHVHWLQDAATPSGNVKWQIEYAVARGYGVGTYPAPTTLSTVQAATGQYVHMITDDDDMTIANSVEIEPDSVILGRIFRDPADPEDTSTDDAFLLQVDIHYQRSHIGTTERNRPWTSTGY